VSFLLSLIWMFAVTSGLVVDIILDEGR